MVCPVITLKYDCFNMVIMTSTDNRALDKYMYASELW